MLVVVVLLAGFSAETGGIGAAGLAVASVGWLLVNGPVEGPVLLAFTPRHGLTGADLAGLAGLGLAEVDTALPMLRGEPLAPCAGAHSFALINQALG